MRKTFLLILFFMSYLLSYAQVMTAYEKKCYALRTQFLRKMGVDESILKNNNSIRGLEALITTGDLVRKVNTEKGLLLMLQLNRELKEAEKLKTPIEIQRQLVEAKKNADIKLKNEQKEKYDNSDNSVLKRRIKANFEGWARKGEFEKQIDYQNRISDSSEIYFNAICSNNLEDNCSLFEVNLLPFRFRDEKKFKLTLLKYDTETEKYSIELLFNGFKFITDLAISIDEAKSIKQNFNNYEHFTTYIDSKDFVFFDNYLVPTKIYLVDYNAKNYYKLSFANKYLKKISFSASELNLKTQINYIFNVDEYYKSINKSDVGHKINSLGWGQLIQNKYKMALHTFEIGIKLVEKTDGMYPYLLGNLAHAYLFNDEFEKAHKIYFENLSLKLDNISWKEAVLKDFEEFGDKGYHNSKMDEIKKELLSLK